MIATPKEKWFGVNKKGRIEFIGTFATANGLDCAEECTGGAMVWLLDESTALDWKKGLEQGLAIFGAPDCASDPNRSWFAFLENGDIHLIEGFDSPAQVDAALRKRQEKAVTYLLRATDAPNWITDIDLGMAAQSTGWQVEPSNPPAGRFERLYGLNAAGDLRVLTAWIPHQDSPTRVIHDMLLADQPHPVLTFDEEQGRHFAARIQDIVYRELAERTPEEAKNVWAGIDGQADIHIFRDLGTLNETERVSHLNHFADVTGVDMALAVPFSQLRQWAETFEAQRSVAPVLEHGYMPQCPEVQSLLDAVTAALGTGMPAARQAAIVEALQPFRRGGAPRFWDAEDLGVETDMLPQRELEALSLFLHRYEATPADYILLDQCVSDVAAQSQQAKMK